MPSLAGPAMGYALADEFAKYTDYMLTNCLEEAGLVSQVFVPDVSAMTLFMDKVFEDSISEYLTAVISSAKAKEELSIYLHTLATAIYACTQLIELIAKNPHNVYVDRDSLKFRINEIFAPYMSNFLDLELQQLKKRFKTEIDKWDHRKFKAQKAKDMADKAKAESAKKNQLVNSMKAMVMAPVTLLAGSGMKRGASQPLLADVEEQVITLDTATYDTADDSINSLISLELALHLMHTNKESLGRVLVITASTDMTKLRPGVQKIFVALLKVLGDRHLKPAFDKYRVSGLINTSAIDKLSNSAPMDFSNEGNKMINMDSLQFFDLIHMGDLVQQMIQGYYQEDIVNFKVFNCSVCGLTSKTFYLSLLLRRRALNVF